MNPKQGEGDKKPKLHLNPATALIEMARALECGAAKYGEWNWRQDGVLSTTYISAMQRHMLAWATGEDNDPESGASHLAHVMACCAILIDAEYVNKLEDDRPEGVGSAAYAIHRFTKRDDYKPSPHPAAVHLL